MKLSVRTTVVLTAGFAATGGLLLWVMASRMGAAGEHVAKLEKEIAELGRKDAELAAKLTTATAGRDASALAAAAADRLARFVDDRKAALRDPAVLARLVAPGAAEAVVADLLKATAVPLDQVTVYGPRGVPAAVAPAGAVPVWPALALNDLKDYARQVEPLFKWKAPDKGGAWTLTVGMPFRGGPKRAFLGVLVEAAALDVILKGAADGLTPDTETRFLVLEKTGTVVHAPSPDQVGRTAKELPELAALADARDGQPVEIKLDMARWVAVKRPAPLAMTIIGLAAIGTPAGSGSAAAPGGAPGLPIVPLVGAVLVIFAASLALVVMPLGRAAALAKAAEAMAGGAAAVEIKDANAADELGALARAIEKVGENLAAERRHREEMTANHANLQRDHQRSLDEIKELKEYSNNLETKMRQQQAALEGEVASARQELETARTEIESLRAQVADVQAQLAASAAAVAARDTAIAERDLGLAQRDQALAEAGTALEAVQGQLAHAQSGLAAAAAQVNELRSELETRKSAPAAVFSLFAEASEALTVEMTGLVELVQGYVGQIVGEGAMTDEQQSFVTTVIGRSAKSQRLMGDLRDFANIARPDGLAREPINLVTLLTDVVAAVQQSADDRGLTLTADLPAELPECIGDEARLRQMFTVTLTHAIRFTPEAGEVKLSVALREGLAGIRIEDGADPIPLKSEEVFDHFHAADEELMETRGTGLRFPILRAIATAHGGSVDLAITETGGNLYFFRLPVREGAPDSDATAALFAGVSTGETPAPFDFGGSAAPAAPAAEAGGFPSFEAFAAGAPMPGALAAAEPLPAFDLSATPDLSAEGPTTDSIMAEPLAPDLGGTGLGGDLWTVPGDTATPPTLDLLEAGAPADLAPPAEADPAAPPLFGSDEIIQE